MSNSHDVSFSYDGKRSAVADLSFSALPGERVALVGPTGSGKSTALALLHRAFDPQSGFITVDGTDIRDLTLTGLRRNIGVVFQETLLFNRSIAENLRVGNPNATDAELRDAAARAQALEFIERNAEGFEARVGERGRLLSGGERQRLSIARALLKDPPILILDEATSALDPLTEARLNVALDEVMKGRTTFVIAHRLATIRDATRILVFRNGRIVETGTFDELRRRGGFFAELARRSSAPYLSLRRGNGGVVIFGRAACRPEAMIHFKRIAMAPDLTFDVMICGVEDGPLVLLLHGFAESFHMWRSQMPALAAAGYRAVAPSQRGYSAGARPDTREPANYSFDHLINDALSIAAACGNAAWPLSRRRPRLGRKHRLGYRRPLPRAHCFSYRPLASAPERLQPRARGTGRRAEAPIVTSLVVS